MALGSGTWKMTHHANARRYSGCKRVYYEVVQLPIGSRNSPETPSLVKIVTLKFESQYIGSVAGDAL